MKTEWDYTGLAKAYLKRPDYSDAALMPFFELADLSSGKRVCDVGAGVAHLTLKLLQTGCRVDAVEPNDDMRRHGITRTSNSDKVEWSEGVGEQTHKPDNTYDAVTFGSSFNVCDQQLALKESHRILKSGGWFAAMWNHRKLDDPIQREIEDIIRRHIPDYGYGKRREDQTDVINASHLFGPVHYLEGDIIHEIADADLVEAWRSHATLARQAKEKFDDVVNNISEFVSSLKSEKINVPYTTRLWAAQKEQ